MVPGCRIDHITVTAPTLETGAAYVQQCLGVRLGPGGEHPRMGTHNLLMKLGDAMFLEVIAVNPQAPAPGRPRWFALDALPGDATPRLRCWVARTDDIHAASATAGESLGPAQPMTRGSLEWLISIPDDGSLPLGGAAPVLIEWHTASHPAAGMADFGCSLEALELLHPEPQRVQDLLHRLALQEPGVALSVTASSTAGLVARIRTPHGVRTLG